MTPSESAEYILERYWDGTLPVNSAEIASQLGMSLSFDEDIDLSGYYDQQSQVISINPKESLQRQRYTIAHEIGHAVLGHGSSPRENSQQFNRLGYLADERDANSFADQLLIPKEILHFLIFRKKITTIEELCFCFDVSPEAMKIRLNRLGYFS